ncbi:DUF177 domain-containing protein [Desulforhopalus sp. IMCC35007]|uniref:YceD family protein n=1 Tax=Desulforhopalus sp. IMCC35007 TaxID=2569543 RepID=UPI0010AE6815|nr:DUF177 domain-containing protein [Desulforhopalus sp. IMCC35007]TKB09097.1 DUF177 domain-containing protein [Desulforhopalus sp. IMCC35007]
MKITFDKITDKTERYDLTSVAWFPKELGDLVITGPSWVSVVRHTPETLSLKGECSGRLHGICARCGIEVDECLQFAFEHLVTNQKEEVQDVQEIECPEDDLNTIYLLGPELDIDEVLREQAYLESPVRMLCGEDCRGICPGCGAQLNSESCRCSVDYSDSPFAILGKINNK